MSIFKAITNFFRAQPQFDIETGKWDTKHYPCGCSANGPGELPPYCPEHDAPKDKVTK